MSLAKARGAYKGRKKALKPLFDRLWKWGRTKKYEDARDVALREMLKGEGCDWTIVESVIAEGNDRRGHSVTATRLRAMHSQGTTAAKTKTTKKAKKKAGKKKAAKKKAAKKKVAKQS